MRRIGRLLFVSAMLLLLFAPLRAGSEEALEQALSLAAEGRLEPAQAALAPLLEREPDHVEARLLLGTLLARRGQVSEAIDTFNALVREDPGSFEAYNNLAVLYAVQGRLEEARETLLAALEHQPSAIGYANLGDVYTDLARRAYLQARALDPAGEAAPDAETAPAEAAAASGAADDETPGTALVLQETQSAAAEEAAEGAGECLRIGGFEDREAVGHALEALRPYRVEVAAVRLVEDRQSTSWRVYLPPLGSQEEAAAKVREIEGRGVRDIGIIGEGDLANGISFGVYRDEDNMRRRLSALEALGYPVRTAPEGEVASEYVLEVRAPNASEAVWNARFPGHRMRFVDCPGQHSSE